MNANSVINEIKSGRLDGVLSSLYGDKLNERRERLIGLVNDFTERFGDRENLSVFSVAGRSELSGNHTYHNHGRVIAASIDLDIIAVAAPRSDRTVTLVSKGFTPDVVDLDTYTEPRKKDAEHSVSLVAGMANGFVKNGHKVGGFDAVTTSNVLKGSGLSSSAAFEDMVGTIFNYLYNDGKVGFVEIARLAQYSENVFFGKPCGLMDQVACAAGGIVAIDFADPDKPAVKRLDFDISGAGYRLCIVDTGGSHSDLTSDYASVPAEMKAVASYFGKPVLREVSADEIVSALPALREKFGDRAVLRALHFVSENERVARQTASLEAGDIDGFFEGVTASGRSSAMFLQNAYSVKDVTCQGITIALALCDRFFASHGCRGAYRLHGGGFAGTIQAFVPEELCEEFRLALDGAFGEGACHVLRVRLDGATKII